MLDITKQAFSKNPKIKNGFIFSVKVGSRKYYHSKSVEQFKLKGDGRFTLRKSDQPKRSLRKMEFGHLGTPFLESIASTLKDNPWRQLKSPKKRSLHLSIQDDLAISELCAEACIIENLKEDHEMPEDNSKKDHRLPKPEMAMCDGY